MKVTLQTLTGTKYFLEVEPQEKVKEVKVKIFRELDMKSKVRLMWQNKQLEDAITLRAQGITEDTIIQMLIETDTKIKIGIKTLKKGEFTIELSDSSTMLDLMESTEMSTLQSNADVSDFYFGKISLCDDNLPFHFYGISDGSVITQTYEGSFELIIIDASNYTFFTCITVRSTDSIKALKDKVLDAINFYRTEDEWEVTEDEVISFHKQTMTISGDIKDIYYHELDRESKSISGCGIKPLDVITFIRYHGDSSLCPNITIDEPPLSTGRVGWRKMFEVYNLETVLSLRLKIQHQFHIPYEKQNLIITGMEHPVPNEKKIGNDKLNMIVVNVID